MRSIGKQLIEVIIVATGLMGMVSYLNAQVAPLDTRVDTNLVLIDVLVMDKAGRPVTGIGADKFELFVDNAKQRIDNFSSETAPVTFGIVYDMHPTTLEKDRVVIDSLREFKAKLPADDDVFVTAFNMKGTQVFDFIPTVDQLERHMTDPATRTVRSLYDAVDFASNRIQSSRHQKRVLLIISDSADHQSRRSFTEVRARLMTLRTEVYAIIVEPNDRVGYVDLTHDGQPRYATSSDASMLDRAALSDLTTKTGGATFFSGPENAARLTHIYQKVAAEMRSHYTLGFYPETIDRLRHQVRIRLHDVPGGKDMVLTHRMSFEVPAKRSK